MAIMPNQGGKTGKKEKAKNADMGGEGITESSSFEKEEILINN